MMKLIKYLFPLLIIAAVVVAAWIWWPENKPDDGIRLQEARIKTISEMMELCTLDISEEMAIKDSIHGKWIVARQKIVGRVRFDLDSLRVDSREDTLIVTLPPERVDILESAESDAYQVLDSWDATRSLFPRTITAAEENAIKRRWQKKARERIYARGYVRQAREEAKKTLISLFEATGQPIIILDPLPAARRVE